MKRRLLTVRDVVGITLEALADAILGPRCHVCRTRVYPKDELRHYRLCCRRPG